jgi:hypothetical protein
MALVLAPELMLTEVTNALSKLQRAGGLYGIDQQPLFAYARHLVDQIEHYRKLLEEVLALAAQVMSDDTRSF